MAFAALALFSLALARVHLAARDEANRRKRVEAQQGRLAEAVSGLEQENRARTRLLDSIVTTREQAREAIATSLHDGPIQALAAVGFGLDRVERRLGKGDVDAAREALAGQRDQITNVISELRRLMADLRPPALDESGLESAVREGLGRLAAAGVVCRTDFRMHDVRVDPAAETLLYRVAQAAISNVEHHAGAEHCTVRLELVLGGVLLEVSDDGCGFDPSVLSALDPGGHGLSEMRERVHIAGGAWRLESTPRGTTVSALVPTRVAQPSRGAVA